MMMSKKSAIILILTVFLGTLAALIWFYFTRTNLTPKPIVNTIPTESVYDPFGTNTTNVSTSTYNEVVVGDTNQEDPGPVSSLRKISEDPISGYSVNTDKKDLRTYIRYILRANGNIYEVYSDSLEQKRLSITTIPKIYESLWLPGGEKLIIRYLKDNTENIETFSVKINPATTTLNEFEGGVDGNFLTENTKAITLNPLGDKIFYLVNDLKGVSGFVSKPDGLNKSLLFESPLTEWLISWPKEGIITLNTKPSAKVPGYLYFLDSKTGSFSRVIGNVLALTSQTNYDAKEVLYSSGARNVPRLYLLDIESGESKLLPWNTLPEKCIWGSSDKRVIYCAVPKSFPAGDYPDLWYQGLISFTDEIWKIDTDTEATTLVSDLEVETNNKIDAVNLQLDQTDSYLFFTNKTDLTLWSLKLK